MERSSSSSPSDPVKLTTNYVTWYKPCDHRGSSGQNDKSGTAAATTTTSTTTTTTTAATAAATASTNDQARRSNDVGAVAAGQPQEVSLSVREILRQIHQYCIEELHTTKYQSKPGASLGGDAIKKDMEDPDSTHCSNADWQLSSKRLGLTDQLFRDVYQRDDPCQAGKMYHFVFAGIGSWISNIANIRLAACIDLVMSVSLFDPRLPVTPARGHKVNGAADQVMSHR